MYDDVEVVFIVNGEEMKSLDDEVKVETPDTN